MVEDPGAQRLLIISPVYCEAEHLDRTVAAVAAQIRPPDRWIIIDDGSHDETLAIARRWEGELPFLKVMEARQETPSEGVDRLTLAREARAFNMAIEAADCRAYTHVGKLDGDIELPPHWFATLLDRFRTHERLGITGGRLEEATPRGWQTIPIPASHVHGAVKLYARECLEAIGGITERLAWDTIDETYARMRGYDSHSLPLLVARHHRAWGSAQGRLRGRARHGECAWILHQPVLWALLRSVKLSRVPPVGLSGAAFACGYARAATRQTPQVDDAEFRSFVRRELRARLRQGLVSAAASRRAAPTADHPTAA